MAKYPFLSDEWVKEARRIREEQRGTEGQPAFTQVVKINHVITEVPFGDGTVNAHMDTSSGQMEIDTGHLEGADVTVTLDYETAKAIMVDGNPQAGMQAFMAGKVKVMGDMTKLMALQTLAASPNPQAQEIAQRIKDITE